jgi:predicted homoserine dehydrogenase-like protein
MKLKASEGIRGKTRIGVVGTGMIARSFAATISRHHPDLVVTRLLTRRPVASVCEHDAAHGRLTTSLDDLLEHSDLMVECSGDAVHATDTIERAFEAGLPVVTMNSEMHITTGSYLAGRGYLTEAEGDQPGSLAALHEEAVQMGFKPLVYGNMKGYLNLNPTPEEMHYWAQKQALSVASTTSFTDGTKVQIEQAFIANGTGATILQRGLAGLRSESLQQGAFALAEQAAARGSPVADYLLASGWVANGVFVVGTHEADCAGLLSYFKLGPGPYYIITRPYHLCSLEIAKTIRRVLAGGKPLLTNGADPSVSVAAVAKHALEAGTRITTPIGGFQLRGEAVLMREHPAHVPIGLLQNATLRRRLEPGQMVCEDDVDVPESRAAVIARGIVRRVCARAPLPSMTPAPAYS